MALIKSVNRIGTNLLNAAAAFWRPQCNQYQTYRGTQMKRDQKRRLCVKEFSLQRSRLLCLYRNNILPPEIREVASQEIIALPRDSNYIRLRNRCYVTSRPRALIRQFRVSRIIFRHLADYNKLCGVQRAMW